MLNSLTREVGWRVGPVLLETLVKHYLDQLRGESEDKKNGTRLKQDDVLYDQVFTVVKAFLNAASFHTVDELQGFSNTKTPSPPWTHVVRVIIPVSVCEKAAVHLVQVLGGEEVAKRVVGGVKWWQVRGINGIDAQWITAKKDWREAKRRYKMQQKQRGSDVLQDGAPSTEEQPAVYRAEMDEMRCILYLHGGGYYFGSIDQERYSIQRHARKINGRVFAINYRLAPQYPFPCALQDALAAYLFLIEPPPGAAHSPVNHKHIIVAGDSAGGGLSLALLQVIRDLGLPMPAGGVLISPWCDLTHSFPSVHTNTDTDVIPTHGLSFHKPSTLWPPPSPEESINVHQSLRRRIRQAFIHTPDHGDSDTITTMLSERQSSGLPVDIGATTPLPPVGSFESQNITLTTKSGEDLEVNRQVHFYTQNSLITHPLISPVLSYLGGLPPLLFIASDKEVLRDEIIYTAHKAANPSKYPINEHLRSLYPALQGINERHPQPTSVHLQVYDDTAHILPVLFSFTTPAKYCFRSIATFCKFVTDMNLTPRSNPQSPLFANELSRVTSPEIINSDSQSSSLADESTVSSHNKSSDLSGEKAHLDSEPELRKKRSKKSLRRTLTSKLTHAGSAIKRATSVGRSRQSKEEKAPSDPASPPPLGSAANRENSVSPSDVGGPRFRSTTAVPPPLPIGERTAGDPAVYADITDHTSWGRMIRERVSTQGIIRSLEPESDLDAFTVPPESIGVLSELTIRRFLEGESVFGKKFSHTVKTIEKHRKRHLEKAQQDGLRRMTLLQNAVDSEKRNEIRDSLKSSPGWGWAWALDEDENPPPSSIVSRRDTEEARKLAEIADQAILGDDQTFSGNNLWGLCINFLTNTPSKPSHVVSLHPSSHGSDSEGGRDETQNERGPLRRLSRLFSTDHVSSPSNS
ncbi:hypothetical protein BDQ17DRAFT_1297729 [Cyathus striatus]|nr:hypothetical protein BDQ17DRAFT_1297729 [Cyathus striatus]